MNASHKRRHAMKVVRAIGTAVVIAALASVWFATTGRAQIVQGPANIRPQTAVQVMGTRQIPWIVAINPSANAVPIGGCQGVYIDVKDGSGKANARNPMGRLIGMQDFDWTATGAAVGIYDGPNAWAVCACPTAVEGTTINVSATYPAQSLPDAAKVPGLAFRSYIDLPVAAKRGSGNPAGCDALKTTTVAISVPGGTPPRPTGPVASPTPTPTAPPAPTTAPTTSATPTSSTPAPTSPAPPPALASPTAPAPTPVAPAGPAPTAVAPTTAPASTTPQTPTPVNPTGFTATQTGEGIIVLSWQAVPNVTFYQVWGPGLPNTGMSVTGTSQVVTGVAAGSQQWIVGSYYMPGPVATAVEAFPKATLLVTSSAASTPPPSTAAPSSGGPIPNAAATGRYRVVANGFRVLHQTKDEPLSRDGHGDEVYAGFTMFHFDRRSSQLLDRDNRRTRVIGEGGFPGIGTEGRVKGGTATPDGGFQQRDVFPPVADPSQRYGATPTDFTFPFKIWEGQLTNAQDAVIILPTLWEWDGIQDGYNKWFSLEVTNAPQIWSDQGVQAAVNGTQLALITPPGTIETSFGPHLNAGGVVIFALETIGLFPPVGLLGNSYDRPIGVGMNGNTFTTTAAPQLPRRAIVLTREIVENALTRLAAWVPAQNAPILIAVPGTEPMFVPAVPPGTIGVQLFEAPADDLQGMYLMYIQVERVP